jgi:hypothetical protein
VPGRREKRQAQFDRFSRREDTDMIVDVLWHYVRNIPRYAATEGEYWALSCLPSTTPRRLTAISLHTMEAIYITEGDDGIPIGQVITSEDALFHRFGSWDAFQRDHPRLRPDHEGSKYEDAGTDRSASAVPSPTFTTPSSTTASATQSASSPTGFAQKGEPSTPEATALSLPTSFSGIAHPPAPKPLRVEALATRLVAVVAEEQQRLKLLGVQVWPPARSH